MSPWCLEFNTYKVNSFSFPQVCVHCLSQQAPFPTTTKSKLGRVSSFMPLKATLFSPFHCCRLGTSSHHSLLGVRPLPLAFQSSNPHPTRLPKESFLNAKLTIPYLPWLDTMRLRAFEMTFQAHRAFRNLLSSLSSSPVQHRLHVFWETCLTPAPARCPVPSWQPIAAHITLMRDFIVCEFLEGGPGLTQLHLSRV